ncbi:unnamed protein product [Trichobilharzia szidati]|nr:unnamed protein product [Trichobilharzia szidati]
MKEVLYKYKFLIFYANTVWKMAKNTLCVLMFIIQAFTILSEPSEAVNFDEEEEIFEIKNIYPFKCYTPEEEATTQGAPVTTPTTTEHVEEETTTVNYDDDLYYWMPV